MQTFNFSVRKQIKFTLIGISYRKIHTLICIKDGMCMKDMTDENKDMTDDDKDMS